MRRSEIRPTTILTDAEVEALAQVTGEILGPDFVAAAANFGVDAQRTVRFHAVSASCVAARQKLGLSVKDVAARLQVPQYRLKAIESGTLRELRPEVFRQYISFLGLDRWFGRWVRMNPELAVELGIDRRADRSGRRGGSPVSKPAGAQSNKPLQPAGARRQERSR